MQECRRSQDFARAASRRINTCPWSGLPCAKRTHRTIGTLCVSIPPPFFSSIRNLFVFLWRLFCASGAARQAGARCSICTGSKRPYWTRRRRRRSSNSRRLHSATGAIVEGVGSSGRGANGHNYIFLMPVFYFLCIFAVVTTDGNR